MAVLTAHHWADLDAGLSEMQRVARLRIVMRGLRPWRRWRTSGSPPTTSRQMLETQATSGAGSRELAAMLPAATSVSPPCAARLRPDHFFAALWARPEMFFDDDVVRPMWVWQSISERARQAGRERLAADLESGAWEQRYGHLRKLEEWMSGCGWSSPSSIEQG